MTPDEWDSIVTWVSDSFTETWTPAEAVDLFYKLESCDPSDVWAALNSFDRDRAPDSLNLLIAARREAKDETAASSESWAAFTMRRYGKPLTPAEVVERIHASQPQCGNATCKLHNTRIV